MNKKVDWRRRIRAFWRLIVAKLFRINDSPQKIALGSAIGVFAGIFPGTGPLAAVFLAVVCRANRAAALVAGLLTNTWLSIATLLLAVKAGALLFGVPWQELRAQFGNLRGDFHWRALADVPWAEVLVPVAAGYIMIAAAFGAIVYVLVLAVLVWRKNRDFCGSGRGAAITIKGGVTDGKIDQRDKNGA